jgi:hypothetical protein
VQGLKLEDSGELLHAPQLFADDIFGYLRRQGQRKPHGPGLEASIAPLSMFLDKLPSIGREANTWQYSTGAVDANAT